MTMEHTEGKLLRIFMGEADKVDGAPVFEKLLELARKNGLMGATVLRGIESFGQERKTHTARLLRLSEDLPVVLEIVDEPEKIDDFIPLADDVLERAGCGGLLTTEKVLMKRYIVRG